MNTRIMAMIPLLLCSAMMCRNQPVIVTPPDATGGAPDAGPVVQDAGAGAAGASGAAGDGGNGASSGASGAGAAGGAPPTDSCSRAEAYALSKGCTLKHPKAATWAAACQNGKANGLDMQDDCILKQTTCPAILACTSKAPPN